MKDAYYFQHDSNAHNDPKMLAMRIKKGWEGIGLYWTFLEILRDLPGYKYECSNGYIAEIELRLSTAQATLQAWLNEACEIGLLTKKDGFLYSESFLRRMEEIDEKRAKLSEAGRRGGLKSSQAQARLKPPSSRKGKESKESKVSKVSKVVSESDFLASLKINPAYQYIDLEQEYGKMDAWLLAHKGRKKTKKFVVNWLNKIEVPLSTKPQQNWKKP